MTEACPTCGMYREIFLVCARCGVKRCETCAQTAGLYWLDTTGDIGGWLCNECVDALESDIRLRGEV
jgi:hypothetical protein